MKSIIAVFVASSLLIFSSLAFVHASPQYSVAVYVQPGSVQSAPRIQFQRQQAPGLSASPPVNQGPPPHGTQCHAPPATGGHNERATRNNRPRHPDHTSHIDHIGG